MGLKVLKQLAEMAIPKHLMPKILCQKSYAKILGSKLAHFLEQMDPSGNLTNAQF